MSDKNLISGVPRVLPLIWKGLAILTITYVVFEGSELGRSFTQTTNYNCLNHYFLS
jgi:hypothetical protein